MRSAVVIAIALAASTGPAAPRDAASNATQMPEFVVYCYDAERQLVVRELASDCHGRVVSAAQADVIKKGRSERLGREIRNDVQSAPPGTTTLRKIGTGFFVDLNGKLVTNHHVVVDCKALIVESAADDQSGPATVQADDAAQDLALLDTTLPPPEVAAFDGSGPIESGAFAAAVGYPDQGLPPRIPLLTRGVVETLPTGTELPSGVLVLRAEVHPGDSGGPIIDAYGLVIGMTRAKLNIPLIYSRTGNLLEQEGFGIPSATIRAFLAKSGVGSRVGPRGSQRLDPDVILSDASLYVVRVDCWE